jgi:acyl carrier protein
MTVKNDVLDAVNEVLSISGRQGVTDTNSYFKDIMDSMNVLESILILEEKEYSTTHISIEDLETIQTLIDALNESS